MNNDRPPACKTGNAVTINCESTLPRLRVSLFGGMEWWNGIVEWWNTGMVE